MCFRLLSISKKAGTPHIFIGPLFFAVFVCFQSFAEKLFVASQSCCYFSLHGYTIQCVICFMNHCVMLHDMHRDVRFTVENVDDVDICDEIFQQKPADAVIGDERRTQHDDRAAT